MWIQHQAMMDWVTWAINEIETWPDTGNNAVTQAEAAAFFSRAAADFLDPERRQKQPRRTHRSTDAVAD
jgi:hypothetical protein